MKVLKAIVGVIMIMWVITAAGHLGAGLMNGNAVLILMAIAQGAIGLWILIGWVFRKPAIAVTAVV